MNLQRVFCPELDCPARGQQGKGNIGVHSEIEQRYICHECGSRYHRAQSCGKAYQKKKSRQDETFLVERETDAAMDAVREFA